jgi:hypothetical protein
MKQSILRRFPDITKYDIVLRDDGEGVYIDIWNSDKPKPTMEQVYQWVEEDSTLPKPLSEIEAIKKDQADLIFSLMMNGVL